MIDYGVSNMESNITANALDVSDQFPSSEGLDSFDGAKGYGLGFQNGFWGWTYVIETQIEQLR